MPPSKETRGVVLGEHKLTDHSCVIVTKLGKHILVEDLIVDNVDDYKVGLLPTTQRFCHTAVRIVSKHPAPANEDPIYRFGPNLPCRPAGWLALLLIKAGDVEINPGPTTTRKQVWICDICHRQIHGRK